MESLMIDIPGTNRAGHMSGSREIKNGNEDSEVRNDVGIEEAFTESTLGYSKDEKVKVPASEPVERAKTHE